MLDSLYTFRLCMKAEESDMEGFNSIDFGHYKLIYSIKTSVSKATYSNKELILLGDVVELQTGEVENLASSIISADIDLNLLLKKEYYLGGKYVIFFRSDDKYYILGDATSSVPAFYYTGTFKNYVCASAPLVLVQEYSLVEDRYLMQIRNSGPLNQAMPFDLTEYKDILQLIPNHYLSWSKNQSIKSTRFINFYEKATAISPQTAAQTTLPLIKNLSKYYSDKFILYCPLTSGRDSRVVLGFLKEINKEIECFTIKHNYHKGNEQDLVTPVMLCKELKLPHSQILDAELTVSDFDKIDTSYGKDKYSTGTLLNIKTFKIFCEDGAIVNGSIIGQVGKSSLHRNIPKILATPAYFRCKLHNYSKEAKIELKNWLNEIHLSGERVSNFDLFSIENRMGRWAAQSNLVAHLYGLQILNIFNSRSIIYEWTKVVRKKRMHSLIHIELLKELDSSMLEIPFEKENNFLKKLSKSGALAYYFASFLKHWYEKFMWKKKAQ